MYWAVVGTWTGIEALGGWLFTWYVPVSLHPLLNSSSYAREMKVDIDRLPFYSLIKTIFFLYLSLPQTEVSLDYRKKREKEGRVKLMK